MDTLEKTAAIYVRRSVVDELTDPTSDPLNQS